MKKILLIGLIFGLVGCNHLIENEQTKVKVEQRLQDRTWLPLRTLEVSQQERQALDFLYAYMGMGDAVDFSEELYLSNVRSSLQAKKDMVWSKDVPNDLFLHFILPIRVNNENLDTSRVDFYAELKDRVKGLSMEDAILEVNHWCHEKVVYVPSDSRTSAPSATVRSAYGRCGEESTFTVAALRAVGIPARQIYTPRWAHTDDNHAWVEAWANGKWYYIGACEPEPILNCGWFDAPAKRAMLMFTKVFGDYDSNEEVIDRTDGYTEINVTENYAPVKKNSVKVVDVNNNPVQGADVLYTIYNYAQFYPSVRKTSDENGISIFSTGIGDMVIIAKKDGLYGRAKIAIDDSVVTVVLNKKEGDVYSEIIDVVPPVELVVNNGITPEQRKINDIRFAQEDSIRGVYVATFISDTASNLFARKMGLDEGRVGVAMSKSRGNYDQIVEFIEVTPQNDKGYALDLLEVVSDKDLKDTPSSVLCDHLTNSLQFKDKQFYKEYILNPRVDDELIVAYRTVLGKNLNVEQIIGEIDKIVLRADLNPAKLRISPIGVEKLGMADMPALERYAITMFRSNGFAARREPLTEKPQYFNGNEWAYIQFKQNNLPVTVVDKGMLNVSLQKSVVSDPKFYTHFTLAKLNNGEFNQLDMNDIANDMGEGLSYKSIFSKPIELEVGTYQLITGTRMSDGSVAVQSNVFNVEKNKDTKIEMVMRENKNKLQVIANCDPEVLYIPSAQDEPKSIISTTGRGYFVLAVIDAKKEPTTHFLRGLESISNDLQKWDRPIVLVLEDKNKLQHFNIGEFPKLPKTIRYGSDYEQKVINMLYSMVKLDKNTQLPIVIIGDTFGRVVYKSTGYNTSIGQQIKNVIEQL